MCKGFTSRSGDVIFLDPIPGNSNSMVLKVESWNLILTLQHALKWWLFPDCSWGYCPKGAYIWIACLPTMAALHNLTQQLLSNLGLTAYHPSLMASGVMKVTIGNIDLMAWSSGWGLAKWLNLVPHEYPLKYIISNCLSHQRFKASILISSPARNWKAVLLLIGSISILQTQFWPEFFPLIVCLPVHTVQRSIIGQLV